MRTRMVSAREIVGRRIVEFRPNAHWAGGREHGRKVMHTPEIVLDDGTTLVFVTEEHPDGDDYGVWVGRRPRPERRRG